MKNGLPVRRLGLSMAKKDEGRRAREVADGEDLYQITHKRIYQAYEEVCDEGGLLDFAELLLRSHELWLNDANLLAHYQQRFSHLLVDEFQDTNTIQYAWLRVLAGQTGKVMAVGDDDQSIYGWRGAKIENIHQFTEDFADVATVRLEQNYRSTQTILDAANGLIQRNTNRLGKELWSQGDKGEPIKVYAGFNDLDEARFIAERIQQWIEEGGSANEAAILYRSNAQSRVLEEALLRLNIPYQIYGGQRFFERAEVKNALAYMRLMEDRHSDPAFERVVNTPTRGIGDKTLEGIRQLGPGKSNVFVAGRERRSCRGHVYREGKWRCRRFRGVDRRNGRRRRTDAARRACRPHSFSQRPDGISQPRAWRARAGP